MKARSFHMNRSSTACAARPARKTFAPSKGSADQEITRGCTGISDRTTPSAAYVKSPPVKPAGFFVVQAAPILPEEWQS
jgi:hypothetical protein